MIKKNLFLLFIFISCDVFASVDCSKFKFNPDININSINNDNINIESSKEELDGKFGYVKSDITYNNKYMIVPIIVKGGYCLSLRSVDININFPEFNIVIDKRLKKDSCAYNIVLKHEMDHVKSEKNILYSNIENIKKSVLNAAVSIESVFVENQDDIKKIQEEMFDKLKKHKDVVDVTYKIKQELEQASEKIDYRGDSWEIWQCEDFYNEMKNSSDNISID